METLYHNNSLADIAKLFSKRHNDEVKVYNLCLEKDIIYNKNIFTNLKMGLFTVNDHNQSYIILIIVFYIKSVAAVHCEPGKGRTGVMIYSFLIFLELFQKTDKVLDIMEE